MEIKMATANIGSESKRAEQESVVHVGANVKLIVEMYKHM